MENPCDNCLIKVNCTAVCFPKQNYKTLILNAITQTKSTRGTNFKYFQHHNKYLKLLKDTNEQEANIFNRASTLKTPI